MNTKTYTLVDAKRDHPKWFSAGAMNFFKSQLHQGYATEDAFFLVHSSQYDETTERVWKVARFDRDRVDDMTATVEGAGSHELARELAVALASFSSCLRRRIGDQYLACQRCVDDGKQYPSWAGYDWTVDGSTIHLCPEHVGPFALDAYGPFERQVRELLDESRARYGSDLVSRVEWLLDHPDSRVAAEARFRLRHGTPSVQRIGGRST